jgi:serine/threonine protein kinase
VKPSNFLIDEYGNIKLADFGTAYAPDKFFSEDVSVKIR